MAPGTRRTNKTAVAMRPTSATSTLPDANDPSVTNVAGLVMTRPAFLRPMNARNIPMPAVMESLKMLRYGAHDRLPYADERQDDEERTGDRDRAERRLPRDLLTEDDREREVRVEAHAGSLGERIAGDDAHQQASDCGRDRRDDEQLGEAVGYDDRVAEPPRDLRPARTTS